jgi:hypothetical protein
MTVFVFVIDIRGIMSMTVFVFVIDMNSSAIKSAISKLRREGVAPNGASLDRQRANCYFVKFRGKQKGPDGKVALYVGNVDDPRYKYWRGMIDRRNQLKAYERALKALEVVNTVQPTKEKPSVEWYTPPEFVDMARLVLGGIDLDPASNPIAQGWVKAEKYYTKDDDGLAQPWAGRVWCNPPYGKFSKLFMERALEFYQSGQVTDCIFLVNRTGAAWYIDLTQQFTAVCQVRKRISFWTPEGKPEGSPRYYNDFLYLGPSLKKFKKVFSEVGKV